MVYKTLSSVEIGSAIPVGVDMFMLARLGADSFKD